MLPRRRTKLGTRIAGDRSADHRYISHVYLSQLLCQVCKRAGQHTHSRAVVGRHPNCAQEKGSDLTDDWQVRVVNTN